MAWTSQSEEVLATLTRYIVWLKPREEEELEHAYDKAFNPFLGEWKSLKRTTIVKPSRDNVKDILGASMLKVTIG